MALLDKESDSTQWRRRAKVALAGMVVLFGLLLVSGAKRWGEAVMRRAEAEVVAQGSSLDPREVAPALPFELPT